MGMQLTILGCHSPFAGPDQAAPGYLLQVEGQNILLDCGPGTVAALQRYVRVQSIDLVLISHLHPDHGGDLISLGFALMKANYDGVLENPVQVWVPPGGAALFRSVLSLQGDLGRHVFTGMELEEYSAGDHSWRNLRIRLTPTSHPMNCHCMGISGKLGSFGYTADTDYDPQLTLSFADVDLLLAESGGLSVQQARAAKHLLPEEAAEMAKRARAKKLVLTHFLPDTDKEAIAERANAIYSGPIYAAVEGMSLQF